MGHQGKPLLSIVLATRNRREAVLHTLDQLGGCGLDRRDYEILIVDNASEDGTADAVRDRVDRLLPLSHNAGSCAKAYAAAQARGRYTLFLDDDAFPRPGSLARMIAHLERDGALGAAGFRVHLPSGGEECAALPHVFVGCGVGLRSDALRACGGLDPTFFMQAEEYDLSFRLASWGWKVRVLDDLHVEHLKAPQARQSGRTTYYDIRNNLRVIARYLPGPCARICWSDALQRYEWLAERAGHRAAHARGHGAGLGRSIVERWTYRNHRLSPQVFESFFGWRLIGEHMARLGKAGVGRVVLADFGKNIYPFVAAARSLGIAVQAIGDDGFAGRGRSYRGVPVLPLAQALEIECDAIVVSNCAWAFAARRAADVRANTDKLVHCWMDRLSPSESTVRAESPIGHNLADVMPRGMPHRSGASLYSG